MNIGLGRFKNVMNLQLQKNNITANNLANVNTTGFKREDSFLEFLEKSSASELDISTTFTQGALKETKNQLDAAISGSGFFVVETDAGLAYTRDGHFTVNDEGLLTTTGGLPVLGQGGWISISQDGLKVGDVSISHAGEIWIDGRFTDRLRVVDFEDYDQLQKTGSNLYAASRTDAAADIDEPRVIQGNLEGSNVDPVQEMISMIELQRHFESSQRVMKVIDQTLGKAATEVSRY